MLSGARCLLHAVTVSRYNGLQYLSQRNFAINAPLSFTLSGSPSVCAERIFNKFYTGILNFVDPFIFWWWQPSGIQRRVISLKQTFQMQYAPLKLRSNSKRSCHLHTRRCKNLKSQSHILFNIGRKSNTIWLILIKFYTGGRLLLLPNFNQNWNLSTNFCSFSI
jgi:hypothetical protein